MNGFQTGQWTTCASFFDAPGYGPQTDRRYFRLESEPGRGRSSGAERNRVEPTENGEGDERAIYPVRRHLPTAGQNSLKSSIEETSSRTERCRKRLHDLKGSCLRYRNPVIFQSVFSKLALAEDFVLLDSKSFARILELDCLKFRRPKQ